MESADQIWGRSNSHVENHFLPGGRKHFPWRIANTPAGPM